MNWDIVEGNWKELTGRIKAQWGMLVDDRFDVIAGKREEMKGKFLKARGAARDLATRQARKQTRKQAKAQVGNFEAGAFEKMKRN